MAEKLIDSSDFQVLAKHFYLDWKFMALLCLNQFAILDTLIMLVIIGRNNIKIIKFPHAGNGVTHTTCLCVALLKVLSRKESKCILHVYA